MLQNANVMAAISNPDDDAYGQVYNVGSGKNYSVNRDCIFLYLMIQLIYHHELERQETVWQTLIRLKKTFAWKPEMDIEEWIKTQL